MTGPLLWPVAGLHGLIGAAMLSALFVVKSGAA